MALPPEIKSNFEFIFNNILFMSVSLFTKSSRFFSGLTPNKICELAIPRSASSQSVFFPCSAKLRARLTAMVVLPTPPF